MLDLRYPIGMFSHTGAVTTENIEGWIEEIEVLPSQLREAITGLNDTQLDTPYRPDGWTVRQVIHHIADSHMNAYIRFKLALTEENPTIKPYNEGLWAELSDSRLPIEVSLALLESLHIRWVNLLRSLKETDLKKTFYHPESGESIVAYTVGLYSWHGRHHLTHITNLRDRLGWK